MAKGKVINGENRILVKKQQKTEVDSVILCLKTRELSSSCERNYVKIDDRQIIKQWGVQHGYRHDDLDR